MFWTKKILGYKKVFRGTFWKIRHKQKQIYPQTYIEPKYDEFYSQNKVSAHGLVFVGPTELKSSSPFSEWGNFDESRNVTMITMTDIEQKK